MSRFLRLFLLITALFAGPQLAVADAPARSAAVNVLRPALWRVSDADTTIYLFGTIHVLPAGQTWLTGPLARAADSSGELVTELGEVDPAEVTRVVTELGYLPDGQSLRAALTPEDRTRFETALTSLALKPDAFDRLKPWYAANSLLLLQLSKAGIVGVNGPEGVLTERFAAARKPRRGLETIGYQLGLFNDLPLELQHRYLGEVSTGSADLAAQFETIHRAWGAGNAEGLAQALNGSMTEPVMRDRMLIDRNKAWGQWVKTRLDRPGRVFLAVGAGHLAGPGSLQDQLRGLGLRVRRVQ